MGEIFEREEAKVALGFTGERLTSDVRGQVEMEHLHRYFFARAFARGKDVLDIASGEGYGSAYLAKVARSVVGVEINPESVAHASENIQARPSGLYWATHAQYHS
jgi:tRNA/tmRNA/rRNA uracil-C5-methylase (TrmA/RlmC/RlmD family)